MHKGISRRDPSTPPRRFALRARYVFPVSAPPIPDGTLTIEEGIIVAVGRAAQCDPSAPVADLGNAAILPGLVNAHTHLEFSDLPAPLGGPDVPFVEWIRQVIACRGGDRLEPRKAVELGLLECLRCGTTALGEIAQLDGSMDVFEASPLRATLFMELIAPTRDRVAATLESAGRHLEVKAGQMDGGHRRLQLGLSPHAPYSVHPELLRRAVSLSNSVRVPLAFHLAESREEIELLHSGGGPFRAWLEAFGAWSAELVRSAARPLDYLRQLAGAWRTVLIHGNYLDDEEIALLAAHAARMAVIYCPRTHAWFGHPPYPLEKMLAAGALVALGTDSRASSPDLSLLAEMRWLAARHPAIPLRAVLELGTLRGARALGLDGDIGSLEPGKSADLAVVALPDHDATDPHELLLASSGAVTATYLRGRNVTCQGRGGTP